jgi:hypothetical protein
MSKPRSFPIRVRLGEMLRVMRDQDWQDRGLLDDMDRGPILLALYLHTVRAAGCNFNRHLAMVRRELFDCMIDEDVERVAGNVRRRPEPYQFKPDTMARWLEITEADRVRLELRTIGAVDLDHEGRNQLRKVNARLRAELHRRKNNVRTRVEYRDDLAAKAIGAGSPWIAAGVPRSTWYKQQALARETGAYAVKGGAPSRCESTNRPAPSFEIANRNALARRERSDGSVQKMSVPPATRNNVEITRRPLEPLKKLRSPVRYYNARANAHRRSNAASRSRIGGSIRPAVGNRR